MSDPGDTFQSLRRRVEALTGGHQEQAVFSVVDVRAVLEELDSLRGILAARKHLGAGEKTLGDYFAAHALQGLLAFSEEGAVQFKPSRAAFIAYEMADAMMYQRIQVINPKGGDPCSKDGE